MDKKVYTEDCPDTSVPHLPMGQLFYMLHSNGFEVKPDDYIEMLKLTERFGSADIDETAKWICPIVATSESEQSRFYHIIEQYKSIEKQQVCHDSHPIKPSADWLKIATGLLICTFLAIGVYRSLQKTVSLNETNKERTAERQKPFLLDASTLLKAHPADSARIKVNWYFPGGTVQQGLKVVHIFSAPGDYLVKRSFSSDGLRLLRKSDSLLIHVCNDLPKLNIRVPVTAVMAKQPVTIFTDVDADTGTVSYYQWTINDSVFVTAVPVAKDIVFSQEGDYAVECKAVVGTVNAPCTATDNKIIQVQSNQLHYVARFSGATPGNYTGKTRLAWWAALILLVPAAAGLLYSFFKRREKPATVQPAGQGTTAITQGPYDIPFEQNDTKLIQPEIGLRRSFVQMRYHAVEETLALNIYGTINSIIRSGGSPQLVFTPRAQQQPYVLLIDNSNPKSMLTHFFGYLAKSMEEEGLPVTRFYYNKSFVCFNDQYPAGLSLQRLADNWHNATLIILGRVTELVYNVYPEIEEKFWKDISRWQNKAILTPVPLKDWSVNEKVLQENIILVPADVSTLQKMIPALREKIKMNRTLLAITAPEGQYTLRDTDFRDPAELQKYLGDDDILFQWLCAICIYPRLSWPVLIEIGQSVLEKCGQPEALNYSNLLKLCRIPWMQQGVFPQATRLELLKLLKTDNELCAREKLLHMLNYSTVIYGAGGRFFDEEKRRQVITNQFVLHASDNSHYSQYAGSRESFKQIWKNNGILDVPLKKYLNKTSADTWQTPISDGKKSVGLSDYFDLHELTLHKPLQRKKVLAAAASVLLISVWVYLAYGGGAEKLAPMMALTQAQNPQTVSVQMKVIKDFRRCGDSLQNKFEQLNGFLEIDKKRIPLVYNKETGTAVFEVPYKKIATGSGKMMFVWDVNKSIARQIYFRDVRLPDAVTIACLDADKIEKQALYVRYNDTTGYRKIAPALENALYRYTVSALPADFSDSSRIIYFETNQKPRADSIVELIQRTLHIHVKEEYISEERKPPATPILFLNTTDPQTNEADNNIAANGDKESGDYYHGMGDELFQNKQYLQAIQAYARAVNVNPADGLAYYQRGICYEMLGGNYTEKAIAEYTSAIRVNAGDMQSWYRRASVRYELKRYTSGIEDYNKVISLNQTEYRKQYVSSLYFRGKSKYFLNDVNGACEDFKKAADAGFAAAKKDYGAYCGITGNTAKPATDYNNAEKSYSPSNVRQQQIDTIPYLTAAQLSAMLMELATGKRNARDFLIYLRGNDIAVVFNGNKMSFTGMCKLLQSTANLISVNAVPVQNERNQITAMTVTAITTNYLKMPKKQ